MLVGIRAVAVLARGYLGNVRLIGASLIVPRYPKEETSAAGEAQGAGQVG
jgi:hypothetical protein